MDKGLAYVGHFSQDLYIADCIVLRKKLEPHRLSMNIETAGLMHFKYDFLLSMQAEAPIPE